MENATISMHWTVFEHRVWFGWWTQGWALLAVSQACSPCHYNNTWRADTLYLPPSLALPQNSPCIKTQPLSLFFVRCTKRLSSTSCLLHLRLTVQCRNTKYKIQAAKMPHLKAWLWKHIFSSLFPLSRVKFLTKQKAFIPQAKAEWHCVEPGIT